MAALPSPPTASGRGSSRPHAVVNRVIPLILRTPIAHRLLSGELMLVTFTGRTSGRRFTTPVTYLPTADGVLFFSSQRWWRNLRGGAPVTLRLRGGTVEGRALPVEDRASVEREARAYLARRGVAKAGRIVLRLDPSRAPTDEELSDASRDHVVVKVALG